MESRPERGTGKRDAETLRCFENEFIVLRGGWNNDEIFKISYAGLPCADEECVGRAW
jgi:hypothetical protein